MAPLAYREREGLTPQTERHQMEHDEITFEGAGHYWLADIEVRSVH